MEKAQLEDKTAVFNKHRRTILTVLGTGVIAFILGKVFGPSFNLFSKDYTISDKEFKNFRIVETKKEMKFYDPTGNEIFIIDKESFTE
jgi:hypothetical protein